jgi:hypothetical protein
MMRRQFELRWIELTLAIMVAVGTVVQAADALAAISLISSAAEAPQP